MSHPKRLSFEIQAQAAGSQARAARFKTLHNEVLTPLFMPVGTRATVKAQLTSTLEASGSQILLANTYHLMLRPGLEVFKRMGGIHKFMSWDRSVLTDSGGFQIFSLPQARKMSEEGALFKTIEGYTIALSPETSIDAQKHIGSDIMMVLDQCIPSTADKKTALDALGITHRWAARSLQARGDSPQALFGIAQGALFPDLRRQSVQELSEMPFDGYAIGGLAVGEGKSEREDVCELTAQLLPKDRPRYLMGVGTPLDLLEAVHRGVDMFDCIMPTQFAQRGGVFTSRGLLQMRRGAYRFSDEKLDPDCDCPTCQRYSRSYLRHLNCAKETLGWTLLGAHNIYFYHRLMREIRASILEGRFLEFYREKRELLKCTDLDNPINGPKRKPKHQPKTPEKGAYEIQVSQNFASIRHKSSGETMHASISPIEEATQLYVEQSQLEEKLKLVAGETPETARPLVLWDVGLGAAANAMAAVQCYERQSHPQRPLEIVSFENDLDSLQLAFEHNDLFTYLRHSAPAAILKSGQWRSRTHPGLSWRLIHGDFSQTMAQSETSPQLVYFDLFSLKTQPEDWSRRMFAQVFDAAQGGDMELYTYSSATSVRVALLASGFYVAKGRGTGDKPETTVGLTPCARVRVGDRLALLGSDWLGRWERSRSRYPEDLAVLDQAGFDRQMLAHPQFCDPLVQI